MPSSVDGKKSVGVLNNSGKESVDKADNPSHPAPKRRPFSSTETWGSRRSSARLAAKAAKPSPPDVTVSAAPKPAQKPTIRASNLSEPYSIPARPRRQVPSFSSLYKDTGEEHTQQLPLAPRTDGRQHQPHAGYRQHQAQYWHSNPRHKSEREGERKGRHKEEDEGHGHVEESRPDRPAAGECALHGRAYEDKQARFPSSSLGHVRGQSPHRGKRGRREPRGEPYRSSRHPEFHSQTNPTATASTWNEASPPPLKTPSPVSTFALKHKYYTRSSTYLLNAEASEAPKEYRLEDIQSRIPKKKSSYLPENAAATTRKSAKAYFPFYDIPSEAQLEHVASESGGAHTTAAAPSRSTTCPDHCAPTRPSLGDSAAHLPVAGGEGTDSKSKYSAKRGRKNSAGSNSARELTRAIPSTNAPVSNDTCRSSKKAILEKLDKQLKEEMQRKLKGKKQRANVCSNPLPPENNLPETSTLNEEPSWLSWTPSQQYPGSYKGTTSFSVNDTRKLILKKTMSKEGLGLRSLPRSVQKCAAACRQSPSGSDHPTVASPPVPKARKRCKYDDDEMSPDDEVLPVSRKKAKKLKKAFVAACKKVRDKHKILQVNSDTQETYATMMESHMRLLSCQSEPDCRMDPTPPPHHDESPEEDNKDEGSSIENSSSCISDYNSLSDLTEECEPPLHTTGSPLSDAPTMYCNESLQNFQMNLSEKAEIQHKEHHDPNLHKVQQPCCHDVEQCRHQFDVNKQLQQQPQLQQVNDQRHSKEQTQDHRRQVELDSQKAQDRRYHQGRVKKNRYRAKLRPRAGPQTQRPSNDFNPHGCQIQKCCYDVTLCCHQYEIQHEPRMELHQLNLTRRHDCQVLQCCYQFLRCCHQTQQQHPEPEQHLPDHHLQQSQQQNQDDKFYHHQVLEPRHQVEPPQPQQQHQNLNAEHKQPQNFGQDNQQHAHKLNFKPLSPSVQQHLKWSYNEEKQTHVERQQSPHLVHLVTPQQQPSQQQQNLNDWRPIQQRQNLYLDQLYHNKQQVLDQQRSQQHCLDFEQQKMHLNLSSDHQSQQHAGQYQHQSLQQRQVFQGHQQVPQQHNFFQHHQTQHPQNQEQFHDHQQQQPPSQQQGAHLNQQQQQYLNLGQQQWQQQQPILRGQERSMQEPQGLQYPQQQQQSALQKGYLPNLNEQQQQQRQPPQSQLLEPVLRLEPQAPVQRELPSSYIMVGSPSDNPRNPPTYFFMHGNPHELLTCDQSGKNNLTSNTFNSIMPWFQLQAQPSTPRIVPPFPSEMPWSYENAYLFHDLAPGGPVYVTREAPVVVPPSQSHIMSPAERAAAGLECDPNNPGCHGSNSHLPQVYPNSTNAAAVAASAANRVVCLSPDSSGFGFHAFGQQKQEQLRTQLGQENLGELLTQRLKAPEVTAQSAQRRPFEATYSVGAVGSGPLRSMGEQRPVPVRNSSGSGAKTPELQCRAKEGNCSCRECLGQLQKHFEMAFKDGYLMTPPTPRPPMHSCPEPILPRLYPEPAAFPARKADALDQQPGPESQRKRDNTNNQSK